MLYKHLYWMAFSISLVGCAGFPSPTPPSASAPLAESTRDPAERTRRAEALLQALLALGIDYRNGGNSPLAGFDCSGLVAHVFQEAYGIRLPRDARAQSEAGLSVSLAELQAGDLLFYDTLNRPYSHVGIYLGEGRFVHAPKTGARVRVEQVGSRYWAQRFNGARRIEPAL